MFLHFGLAGQFGKNGFGQLFAELYAPLVKAVDAPNNALYEGFMFVHGNQAAHIARVDFVHEDKVGRTVPGEGFVRNQLFDTRFVHALCLKLGAYFVRRFAAHKGFGLGKDVCQQDFVVALQIAAFFKRGDEVNRCDVRTLVQQLEECVLAVDTGFTPNNRGSFVTDRFTVKGNLLPLLSMSSCWMNLGRRWRCWS